MFSTPYFMNFGRLLGRSLEGFGPQVEFQVDQQTDHMASSWQVGRNSKYAKKYTFSMFLGPRPSNFEAKFTKERPQSDQQSGKKISTSWPNI